MTLAAPRSRQGKLTLVLAIIAAVVVVGGTLLWSNTAQANLPTTTATVTQSPAGPANVNPGSAVSYTLTGVLNAAMTGATNDLTLEMTGPGNLVGSTVACGAGLTLYTSVCHQDNNVLAGTYTLTISGTAPASGTLAIPTGAKVCFDSNDNLSCAGEGDFVNGTNAGSVGILTVAGVSVSQNSANLVGVPHTFTWTLPPGFTCESDVDLALTRSCDATDVVLGAGTTGATVTAGPTVSDTNLANTSTVTVTISGNAVGSATVTLLTKFQDGDVAFISTPDLTATKTYAVPAGELRHWDVDQYSEDAAGNTDGILDNRDDPDDATGSFHRACIELTGLTHAADAINITWNVVALGGSVTVSSATEVPGPSGEPCYRWGSNGTGAQQITATWDNGPLTPDVTFFWDGYCTEGGGCADANGDVIPVPLELVKQWNDIDSTSIVSTSGDLAQDGLAFDNSGELDNWSGRAGSFASGTNHDGETIDVTGVAIQGPVGFGHVVADGQPFIDYTFGNHSAAGGSYSGPIDGAKQTYTVSGDCGSVLLEDPSNLDGDGNVVETLTPGDSQDVLSSDKGVGFEILPTQDGDLVNANTNLADYNCDPSSHTTVTICTEEQNDFGSSPLDTAPCEVITIHWTVGPVHGKQTDLAWAGQRKLLEHDWRDVNGACPWGTGDRNGTFYVRYELQQQSVGALSTIVGENAVASGPDFVVVAVQADPFDGDGLAPGNSDCISRVIGESQDPGEFDATAHIVESPSDSTVRSAEADFVIYYMKLEDVTVGLVPGARTGHNSGSFSPSLSGFTPICTTAGASPDFTNCGPGTLVSGDTTERTANVSADVLARVRVRGWAPLSNCPNRPAGVDNNGGVLPAGRCVFPDDWTMKMGGAIANATTPQADIWGGTCPARVAGPFSLLDPTHNSIGDANDCSDSKAPHVNGGTRETVLGNGAVTNGDAPMPVSIAALTLTDSGFLRPADKTAIYPGSSNTFYVTHVPSDPWIEVGTNSNYFNHWNSWGVGSKSGLYTFWTSLLAHGPEVVSCPGAATCDTTTGGVLTGGYKTLSIYTDNHGEAMVWVNGDADLSFSGCLSSSSALPTAAGTHGVGTGVAIKTITGNFCESGNTVGTSTLTAIADYPDKHDKHFALQSNTVNLTWTWGGTKTITVTPSAGDQINTVEFRATNRDGFCDPAKSLHTVLGETVTFLIDSGDGTIIAVSNDGAIASAHSASTTTARAASVDVCVASVQILSTLFHEVDVFITAFDPEGTVQFDLTLNRDSDHDGVRDATDNCVNTFNPDQSDVDGDGIGDKCDTEGPSTSADCTDGKDNDGDGLTDAQDPGCTPPAPTLVDAKWGDVDCNGSVTIGDAQKMARKLIGLTITKATGCPVLNTTVAVTLNGVTVDRLWGDNDCNGSVTIGDAQKTARVLIDLPITQTGSACPGIGEAVKIPA